METVCQGILEEAACLQQSSASLLTLALAIQTSVATDSAKRKVDSIQLRTDTRNVVFQVRLDVSQLFSCMTNSVVQDNNTSVVSTRA
jgi:hypothetical protein